MSAVEQATLVQAQDVTPHSYYRHVNQHRFTVELEFLSSLASPSYLTHLFNQGHLGDAAFVRYLGYLYATWSQPRYVRFLRYPNALIFCRALAQSPAFRGVVGQEGWESSVTSEILTAWAGQTDEEEAEGDGVDDVVGSAVTVMDVKSGNGASRLDSTGPVAGATAPEKHHQPPTPAGVAGSPRVKVESADMPS